MMLTVGPAGADETAGMLVSPEIWRSHFQWAALPWHTRNYTLRSTGALAIRTARGVPLVVFSLVGNFEAGADELTGLVQEFNPDTDRAYVAPVLRLMRRLLDAHPRDVVAKVEHEHPRFARTLRALGFQPDEGGIWWRRPRS
jgi:hypothetical protein